MPPKPPQDDKKARLAAALRENLKRRKAQSRVRRDTAAESAAEPDPDDQSPDAADEM